MTYYWQIAVDVPLHQTFTYACSPEQDAILSAGKRVRILFGNQKTPTIGIAIAPSTSDLIADIQNNPKINIKNIIDIIDINNTYFPKKLFELAKWMSEYYALPFGMALMQILPKHLREIPEETPKKTRKKIIKNNTQIDHNIIENIKLNPSQTLAAQKIIDSLNQYQTFVLQGPTGSGKTEVYIVAIEAAIQKNSQVLVLISEIALTAQWAERLQKRLNVACGIWHSGITDKQRRDLWEASFTGELSVLIGTRSALFAPFPNLGLIIVDEEHDSAFYQTDGLRYSGRDVAVYRALQHGIPIVLGSATPSLESLFNIKRGKYQKLVLEKRHTQRTTIQVIDLRRQKLQSGLSNTLLSSLHETLSRGGQALLFLNRRGYAPTLLCHECAFIVECPHCDAKMTWHWHDQRLHCHHCSATYMRPQHCPQCHSPELNEIGQGTERLELTLQTLFPEYVIARLDRDTIRKKNDLNHILHQIHSGEARIILGTQMLAKGHDFPNVDWVGIIEADSGLFSTDFRANERLAQLLIQVSGRAGRQGQPAQVLLQTHHPDHPQLQLLLTHGYFKLAEQLLSEREEVHFPPIAPLAIIRSLDKNAEKAEQFLHEMANKLRDISPNIILYGPAPAPMPRKADYYRFQLAVQTPERGQLRRALRALQQEYEKLYGLRPPVRWWIEVDPLEWG